MWRFSHRDRDNFGHPYVKTGARSQGPPHEAFGALLSISKFGLGGLLRLAEQECDICLCRSSNCLFPVGVHISVFDLYTSFGFSFAKITLVCDYTVVRGPDWSFRAVLDWGPGSEIPGLVKRITLAFTRSFGLVVFNGKDQGYFGLVVTLLGCHRLSLFGEKGGSEGC